MCELSIGVTVQAITGTSESRKPERTCFLVDNGTPGFKIITMHGKMMWCAFKLTKLYFDNVRLPQENVLGKIGDGFHQMLQTLDGDRIPTGAMRLGGAQEENQFERFYRDQMSLDTWRRNF